MLFPGEILHHRVRGLIICTNFTGQSTFIGGVNDPFHADLSSVRDSVHLHHVDISHPSIDPQAFEAGIMVNAIFRGNTKYFVTLPKEELLLARTLGALGTTYLLFLTAVKADITVIHRTMRNVLIIGSLSVLVPLAMTVLLAHKLSFAGMKNQLSQFLFMAGLSFTHFPYVGHALNELNITTSDLGQRAVSCSMVSETFVWLFLFLGAYLIEPRYLFYCVVSTTAFLLLTFGIIRAVIMLIIQKLPERKPVSELYISSILVVALVMASLTDMIGSISIGVMMFGLVMPNGPPQGAALSEKIELITMEILMPMFYVVAGFNADIRLVDLKVSREILLVILMTTLLKIVGALVAALCCKLRLQHSILLGLMWWKICSS